MSRRSGQSLIRSSARPRRQRRDSPFHRTATPWRGGCYALQSTRTGKWVVQAGATYRATAPSPAAAEPFHFQATDLGTYLLYSKAKRFLGVTVLGAIGALTNPSERADWTVNKQGTTFTFTLPALKKSLGADAAGGLGAGAASPFALRQVSGCAVWPEIEVGVSGQPFVGASAFQEVRGYLDAHTHMAWPLSSSAATSTVVGPGIPTGWHTP